MRIVLGHNRIYKSIALSALLFTSVAQGWSSINVYLTEVPDYDWWAGCFGTASGNLMGFWDRHGFPDFYTGPTGQGLAPLDSYGVNDGIKSLWSSQAGLDGRPMNRAGHYDDYYTAYENIDPDPWLLEGRAEHAPDCLCDFLGISQLKWNNLGGECDGNIDGFSFVYWDPTGNRRVNFVPGPEAGLPARDIQSGLRAWTQYRGYDCAVFTQLADTNPHVPSGKGFGFEDLKAEIDAGYPVLLFLQQHEVFSRRVLDFENANPEIHGMLAYGYFVTDSGVRYVRYRTSWASGDNRLKAWGPDAWEAELPLRGVIGYHPLPKIRQYSLTQTDLTIQWDAPAAFLYDTSKGASQQVHAYVVEMARSLKANDFQEVSPSLTENSFTITNCPNPAFFRIKLVKAE